MQAPVQYENTQIGTVEWQPDAYGVQIALDCAIPHDPLLLLRCYAITEGKPMLVGLPEPRCGRLRLDRHISRETLRKAGCLGRIPDEFCLADREETLNGKKNHPLSVHTGDAVLDELIEQGEIDAVSTADTILLRCTFRSDAPFALAPAFVLCTVKNETAELIWKNQSAADETALC